MRRDVVLRLAAVTALAVALNAVLVSRVVTGREDALSAERAEVLAEAIALRASAAVRDAGPPDPKNAAHYRDALRPVDAGSREPTWAVLGTARLRAVAESGTAPPSLESAEAHDAWLLAADDAREALASRRVQRSEWREAESPFARRWATAAAPIPGPDGAPHGVVRVAVAAGAWPWGPLDGVAGAVLLVSALLGALVVGAFGYALFARRVLRPITALRDGARRLGEGRFALRIDVDAADELGELARAVEDAARALDRSRREEKSRVAELQAMNADLRRARRDLVFAEKMATVGRLASGVAHEVGNPLASVIGFVDLLEQDRALAPDLLPRMRAELDRIHTIIRELLGYARPSDDAATPSDLDVAEPIEAAKRLVQAQRRFADTRFDIRLADGLPPVRADAGRLQQVLLNLFVNAAEAMGQGGRVRVVAAESRDGCVEVEVQDEGPGVPPHIAAHIFEPFFTTKDVGHGTGLGLSVSLGLMESMGGSLRLREPESGPLDSMLAGGACFVVRLPVAGAHSEPALAPVVRDR